MLVAGLADAATLVISDVFFSSCASSANGGGA